MLTFRRAFSLVELAAWEGLLDCIAIHSNLWDPIDVLAVVSVRSLCIKSLYRAIAAKPGPDELLLIWDMKLPLKIHIFSCV